MSSYIDIVESNIFDEDKIKKLFQKADICINLIEYYLKKKWKYFQKYSYYFSFIISQAL